MSGNLDWLPCVDHLAAQEDRDGRQLGDQLSLPSNVLWIRQLLELVFQKVLSSVLDHASPRAPHLVEALCLHESVLGGWLAGALSPASSRPPDSFVFSQLVATCRRRSWRCGRTGEV